jgi:PhnB protein
MSRINPYLNFNGRTEEAFNFYRSVFGGEFKTLMRFKDLPQSEKPMPTEEGERIMHIALPIGEGSVLMGSDISQRGSTKLIEGNNVYVSLNPDSKQEAERVFEALSAGGKVEMGFAKMFWGGWFGSFRDRFGVMWMIDYEEKQAGVNRSSIRKSIDIRAPRHKVWDVLLQDKTYRQYAESFCPGSYAETDWKEGSEARFLNADGDGLYSAVLVHKPAEIITLEHQGVLKAGRRDINNPETDSWKGARETYRVTERNGVTTLTIEQECPAGYADMLADSWDRALKSVKELSER